jgi:hypothetical protein
MAAMPAFFDAFDYDRVVAGHAPPTVKIANRYPGLALRSFRRVA